MISAQLGDPVWALAPWPCRAVVKCAVIGIKPGDDGPVLHLWGIQGIAADLDWWVRSCSVSSSPQSMVLAQIAKTRQRHNKRRTHHQ